MCALKRKYMVDTPHINRREGKYNNNIIQTYHNKTKRSRNTESTEI